MKQNKLIAAAVAAMVVASCNNSGPGTSGTLQVAGNGLPQDVKVRCAVDSAQFAQWFVKGKAAENGAVNPANSAAFIADSNCNFYRWAEQMFLWLTSRDSVYGGNGSRTVMESPVFYTVGPDTTNNFAQSRILYPHSNGLLRASARIRQEGPNRLPVIVDRKGHRWEVDIVDPKAPVQVADASGKPALVGQVQKEANAAAVITGKDGKPIAGAHAYIRNGKGNNILQRLTTANGKHIYIDVAGHEADVAAETEQATNQVLIAQNGSIIYYLLFVNDVYAWYQAGATTGPKPYLSRGQFPTTTTARDSICALARANGKTLLDSNALAIELKTSWVEAKNLPEPVSNYITTTAIVPTYKRVGNTNAWIMDGEKTVKLALIGTHIVGSVAGHPEMVWATFEHRSNSPNVAYQYLSDSGKVKVIPADTTASRKWLLSVGGLSPSNPVVNKSHQTWSLNNGGDTIYTTGNTFIPDTVMRTVPWGTSFDSLSNEEDITAAASNSEVIGINNSVYKLLPGNDVRKNYVFSGATWTFKGSAPTGAVYNAADSSNLTGVGIGTNVLANSTMETFFQQAGGSCFTTCHSGITASLSPDTISHIFTFIKPLPLPKLPPSMPKK